MILKKVGEDIKAFLHEIVNCAVAKVVSEGNVIVYQLDRSGKEVKAIPFLHWREGKVTERADKRKMSIEYIKPEGRSKGLFVSKANKICVPLMA